MTTAALTVGQGRLESVVVKTADGTAFDLGMPGSRKHSRRVRKFIRYRLKHEPAFRAEYADQYTRRGRARA